MAHPSSIGITFPMDIKPGTGEKSVSPEQVRYAIRIIYMYKKITYLGFIIKEIFKE